MPVETLLDSIAAWMRKDPAAPAVRYRGREVSYGELDERSAELAAELRDLTCGAPGTPVAIEAERSPEFVTAALAVLRADMGCLPLDRSLPSERIDRMLAIAGARLRIGHPSAGSAGSGFSVAEIEAAAPAPEERPAYVLFTSGSTGEPKGVAMGHGPLTRLVEWHCLQDEPRGAVTTQFAPVTFDVAWQEILSTLAACGVLEIVPEAARRDPRQLLELLSSARVARLFLPTALLPAVADAGLEAEPPPLLRDVIVAGSHLRITPAIREWFERLSGCRLHNHYGPTETHVVTAHTLEAPASEWPDLPPIGRRLPHVRMLLLSDQDGESGERGELLLGGDCLAEGYANRPELTEERFIQRDGQRWYRTGDLVEARGGDLHYLGRTDLQCKIDGYRIEPGEVEAQLCAHPDVKDAHVAANVERGGRARLVAYIVSRTDLGAASNVGEGSDLLGRELSPPWRESLRERLPEYAVPRIWLRMRALPLTGNGKIDAARLPAVPLLRPSLSSGFRRPQSPTERELAAVWEEQLDLRRIGARDNFFDLGGTSLLLVAVATEIGRRLRVELPMVAFYANPTVESLGEAIEAGGGERVAAPARPRARRRAEPEPVAVVGMACRFPGADGPEEFWQNLIEGRETISRRDGGGGDGLVHAAGVLAGVDRFDASFFGLGPAQARALDPQHRLFLECCWEALEDAGRDPGRDGGRIGVFGGSGPSTYLLNNLAQGKQHTLVSSAEEVELLMATDKEFLTSRVAYTLDLRGPSVNVNGACATSLIAVHHAVESLRGDCDLALAGAASIQVPQLGGYRNDEALPLSADGRCRVFDRDADGTVFGSGVGVVALKRLGDARADGDDIYGVILGSGISSDGAQKVGMAAPSVQGQRRAIEAALAAGDVDQASVGYVEAHGTGTRLGDPIEVAALHEALGELPPVSIGIGSVKTNLGHLGWAAGMAGLLKALLGMRHGRIPATLNYASPNPELRLETTPFFVVDKLSEFPADPARSRVGVSAFGLGGFNAHLVLEPAPASAPRESRQRPRVFPVSAATDEACLEVARSWARFAGEERVEGADLARTLSRGRSHHAKRLAAVATDEEEVGAALAALASRPLPPEDAADAPVVAIFAGHGAERPGLAAGLYCHEPVFREVLDGFDEPLRAAIGTTVAEILYGTDSERIEDPVQVHAVVFSVQVALLRLWESKGLPVDMVLGHSLGQYAAACAAGVFGEADGMAVVLERGRLLEQTTTAGTMAVVGADEGPVRELLEAAGLPLDVAAVNGPGNTIVSGLDTDLGELAALAAERGLELNPLGSLRAGHSRLMETAVPGLVDAFAAIEMQPPKLPLISNRDGEVAGAEVAEPEYWGRHLIETVRFADCLERARELGAGAFVELSGSPGLLGLATTTLEDHPGPFIPVLRPKMDAERSLAQAIAVAYEAGLDVDWDAVGGEEGRIVHGPTYPFQRRSHWIGPSPDAERVTGPGRQAGDLLHDLRWTPLPEADLDSAALVGADWLVVGPESAWRDRVRDEIQAAGGEAESFASVPVGPSRSCDGVLVLCAPDDEQTGGDDPIAGLRDPVTHVLDAVRRLGAGGDGARPPRIWIVTTAGQEVVDGDRVEPWQAALSGLVRSVALERSELGLGRIDVARDQVDARAVVRALTAPSRELAIRGGQLWRARLVPAAVPSPEGSLALPEDRPCLVTGGLGGLGGVVAEALAEAGVASLILAGRSAPDASAQKATDALRARGVAVEIVALDVSNREAVEKLLFARQAERGKPIGGIVHCAGVLDDRMLEDADWSDFERVLGPKVGGAWNLHLAAALQAAPLRFFGLFSSATAVHGNLGQAAYATANAFLDGLARARRREGLPAVSFNWGVWADAGYVAERPELLQSLEARGLGTISSRTGVELLRLGLLGDAPQMIALPNDWPRFLATHGLEDDDLYAELAGSKEEEKAGASSAAPPLRAQLSQAPAEARRKLLADAIVRMLGTYLGDAGEVGPEDDLLAAGLDSLSAIQLRNELQASLGTVLPTRLLARFPTPAAIAAHLLDEVLDLERTEPVEVAAAPFETPGEAGSTPLSLQQQRWLRLASEVGYGRRIVPVLVHASLDRSALLAALRIVVDRHEILRSFYPEGSRAEVLPVDEVVPGAGELFVDVAEVEQNLRPATVALEARRIAESMPDPRLAPSWTLRCLDLGPGCFMLLLGAQHLEFDGSGLSTFAEELRRCYRGLTVDGAAPELEPVASYSEFVAAQGSYLAADVDRDRAFFRGLFACLPGRTLLPGHDGSSRTVARPSRRFTPPEPLARWADVRAAAQEAGANPFALILSSYASMVAELSGDSAVSVCMIRSARAERRFASTVGPFTMPFPVPVYVAGWSPRDLVGQVDDTLAAIAERPHYPGTDLRESTRAFAGLPLDTYFSDVGINFTSYRKPASGEEPRTEVVEVLGEVDQPLFAEYDFASLRRIPGLHLVVAVEGDDLVGNYWFHAERFREEAVAAWAARHRGKMEALLGALDAVGAEVA